MVKTLDKPDLQDAKELAGQKNAPAEDVSKREVISVNTGYKIRLQRWLKAWMTPAVVAFSIGCGAGPYGVSGTAPSSCGSPPPLLKTDGNKVRDGGSHSDGIAGESYKSDLAQSEHVGDAVGDGGADDYNNDRSSDTFEEVGLEEKDIYPPDGGENDSWDNDTDVNIRERNNQDRARDQINMEPDEKIADVKRCVSEVCNDRDDDCDGKIDEGILDKACYTGASTTRGKGECKDGIQRCVWGRWTGCISEVKPQDEICNGRDDDCDGKIDDIAVQKCSYTGRFGTENIGVCKAGNRSCKNGVWTSCAGEVLPSSEACDGKDNDCNGKVDDLTPPPCSKQRGVCSGSVDKCGGAKGWIGCTDTDYKLQRSTYEKSETICDGLDNDCNGMVDESLPRAGISCSVPGAQGICVPGTWSCDSGRWNCFGKKATSELCNDLDDDCDGKLDENACQISAQEMTCHKSSVKKMCGYFFDANKKPIGSEKCVGATVTTLQNTLPDKTAYYCVWTAVDANCNRASYKTQISGLGSSNSLKTLDWIKHTRCANQPYNANQPGAAAVASSLNNSGQQTKISPAINKSSSYAVESVSPSISCFHRTLCFKIKKPIK